MDVKPNSSELSYLLYYASTRRSKVQKVGEFLEKKAGSDISRGKVGYVIKLSSKEPVNGYDLFLENGRLICSVTFK